MLSWFRKNAALTSRPSTELDISEFQDTEKKEKKHYKLPRIKTAFQTGGGGGSPAYSFWKRAMRSKKKNSVKSPFGNDRNIFFSFISKCMTFDQLDYTFNFNEKTSTSSQ